MNKILCERPDLDIEDTRLPEDIAPGPAAEERERREVPGAWPAPAPSWLCLILLIGMVGGFVPSDRLILFYSIEINRNQL